MELETDTKTILVRTKQNWFYILGIILILTYIGTVWALVNANKELTTIKSKLNLQESIAETEAKLDAMKKREAELYPKLEKKYAELEKIQQLLEKKKKELIKKEGIENEIKKMDITTINYKFNELGYSTSIISK